MFMNMCVKKIPEGDGIYVSRCVPRGICTRVFSYVQKKKEKKQIYYYLIFDDLFFILLPKGIL